MTYHEAITDPCVDDKYYLYLMTGAWDVLQLDVDDISDLAEATFQIFLPGVLREATDVDFVGLHEGTE